MREMPTFGQTHSHEGVARFHGGHEDRLVGLRTRVRLNIGCPAMAIRPEELLETVDGELFSLIDEFAAAVIAPARIALGVFVGKLRALGCHYRRRGVVLAGNEFNMVFLSAVFMLNDGPQIRIDILK